MVSVSVSDPVHLKALCDSQKCAENITRVLFSFIFWVIEIGAFAISDIAARSSISVNFVSMDGFRWWKGEVFHL